MSRKIPVLNSPWGRTYERVSDCQRWIEQNHAMLIDGALSFNQSFLEGITREALEFDPVGTDDRRGRRWIPANSGPDRMKVLQYLPA